MNSGHRSGPFKQKNKIHKSKHKSKRALNSSGIKVKRVTSKCKDVKRLSKKVRRLQNKEKRKAKQNFLKDHKKFSTLADIPIVLTLFGISTRCPSELVVNYLHDLCSMSAYDSNSYSYMLKMSKIRNTFQLLVPNSDMLMSCVDAIKASQSILIVCHANDTMDDINEKLLNIIAINCIQRCFVLIQGLKELTPSQRSQQYQHLSSVFKQCLSNSCLCSFDTSGDLFSLMQRISNSKPELVPTRDGRPYILAEQYNFNSTENELSLTGFVRGTQLSVNSLVYIPGIGPCQIKEVEIIKPIDRPIGTIIRPDFNNQLQFPKYTLTKFPDVADNHQEELKCSTSEQMTVPEGTSDYQATWLQYDENEDNSINNEECSTNEDINDNECDQQTYIEAESDSAMSTASSKPKRNVTFADDVIFNDSDNEGECQSNDYPDMSFLKNARNELKDYKEFSAFPSQSVDDVPIEYAYLSHFEDYRNAVKFLRKEEAKKNHEIEMGSKVKITFLCQSNLSMNKFHGNVICAFGLFPHEEKMSLCNILLNRSISSEQMLKSNQKLVFVAGIRRFSASAIFSEVKNADKFKYEESFAPGNTLMASIYAPIMLTPCPVVVFTKYIDGSFHLVASGHLVSCDTNRINLQRVTLRGKPYKINGKRAVVRGMFSNPEDINYFKSFAITSKYGRKGRILNSIGTKGFMKCQFDRPLKSQDVVMMSLYKRIFPKWDFADMNDYDM